jgi:hypothetical protein
MGVQRSLLPLGILPLDLQLDPVTRPEYVRGFPYVYRVFVDFSRGNRDRPCVRMMWLIWLRLARINLSDFGAGARKSLHRSAYSRR